MGLKETIDALALEFAVFHKAAPGPTKGLDPKREKISEPKLENIKLPKVVVQNIAAVLAGVAGVAIFAGRKTKRTSFRIQKAVIAGTASAIALERRGFEQTKGVLTFSGFAGSLSRESRTPAATKPPLTLPSLGEPFIGVFPDPAPGGSSSPLLVESGAARMVRARAGGKSDCDCDRPASALSVRCREICGK